MTTTVIAPVTGRAVALGDVPDPVFAQGMVGYGAAIDPPREVITAVAPVSGRLLKLMPHAFVVLTPDNVGVLVHLGLDTVALDGEGFTTHLQQLGSFQVDQEVEVVGQERYRGKIRSQYPADGGCVLGIELRDRFQLKHEA